MISDLIPLRNVLLKELLMDANNSNLEKIESAIYMKSMNISLVIMIYSI